MPLFPLSLPPSRQARHLRSAPPPTPAGSAALAPGGAPPPGRALTPLASSAAQNQRAPASPARPGCRVACGRRGSAGPCFAAKPATQRAIQAGQRVVPPRCQPRAPVVRCNSGGSTSPQDPAGGSDKPPDHKRRRLAPALGRLWLSPVPAAPA